MKYSERYISVFSVVFGIVFLKSLLSYPIRMILQSGLYDRIEDTVGGPEYMTMSYIITVSCFIAIVLLYRFLPTRKYTLQFQRKSFILYPQRHYVTVWYFLTAIILINCSILFWQAGGVLPLLQGYTLDASSYLIYRAEVTKSINMSLANFTLQLLVTTNIFISFICIRKISIFYRVASVLLLLLAGTFSLDRSFFPVAILILMLIYILYKPISLRHVPRRIIFIFLLMIVSSILLVIYSTKATYTLLALQMFFDRQVHGQWLGMPLYLYFYNDYHITSLTFLHPYILSVLNINVPSTPGRELMEYFYTAEVLQGSAGNMPTFFIGEAYAVAGYLGIILSVLYVSILLLVLAYLFKRMRKTYISCCLYGWMAYKVSSGLTNGVSALLVSSFSFIMLCMIIWIILPRKYIHSEHFGHGIEGGM